MHTVPQRQEPDQPGALGRWLGRRFQHMPNRISTKENAQEHQADAQQSHFT